jgi:hypothetical protein
MTQQASDPIGACSVARLLVRSSYMSRRSRSPERRARIALPPHFDT